jgi:hypothetical protein
MEFQTIHDSVHYVFDTQTEFKNYFASIGEEPPKIIKDWRTAGQLEWVKSDDKRIVQILFRGDMKAKSVNQSKEYVRTIVGSFPVSVAVKMDTDFSNHPDRYMFSTKYRDHKDALRQREKTNKREDMLIYFVTVAKANPVESYMQIYGTNNYRYARSRVLALLNTERIRMAIKQSIKKEAKDLKMSEKWHLEMLKAIIEDSDEKGGTRLGALRLSGEWTGMSEPEDPDEPIIPDDDSAEQLDSPDMQKRLKASRKSQKQTKDAS